MASIDGQLSFAGGLNTVSDDSALQPNQFRWGENARLTEYGAVVKRYGSVALTSNVLPPYVLQGYSWYRGNGAVEGMVIAPATILGTPELFTVNMLAAIGSQAWTSRGGTFSTAHIPSFAAFLNTAGNECVFIADGGPIRYWDGTTLSADISGTFATTYLKVHNQRLWGAGDANYPDSIFYSALNDGETLGIGASGGGQIVIRTFGDERVIGLASVGSSLLIFHRQGISRLTGFGQDDTQVSPEGVSGQTGTIAPQSIVEVDGAAMFISDRGAFVASESSVQPLSTPTQPDPILPVLRTLTSTTIQQIRGVLNRRTQEVLWFIPGYGVYSYHLILRAWSGPWTGEYLTTSAMWSSVAGDSAEGYVIRADLNGRVVVSDFPGVNTDGATLQAPDSGTPILMAVQLRRLYFGSDFVAKSFRFGYLTASIPGNSAVTVSGVTNFGNVPQKSIAATGGGVWDAPGATWDSGGTWASGSGSQNYRVQMSGQGYYIDITLGHVGNAAPVFSRWQMDGFPLGRR